MTGRFWERKRIDIGDNGSDNQTVPRPTTKAALLEQAGSTYCKLRDSIASMGPAATRPFAEEMLAKGKEAHWGRDRNVRDVVIHLYEWQAMLLHWLGSNQGRANGNPAGILEVSLRAAAAGDAAVVAPAAQASSDVPFLPPPYNWKTYGELNKVLWEKHQQTPLEVALNLLAESHLQVIAAIDSFSDEQLFTKSFFSWSGTTSVGSYCVSATTSHYEWALKKLRLHVKTSA